MGCVIRADIIVLCNIVHSSAHALRRMPIRSTYLAKKNEKRNTLENTVIHVISCVCFLSALQSIELIGSAHTLA